ncbi:hypothetical protein GGX14DRAFT_403630 [Mycena pura]|uniref:Uncharacterized protein n=1 Tax=Mycena pura TaxID=153505 RepID=A0AAD6Y4A6_9AGAR|nr:hypothetical protein GGX14DRAFT_403630 [Mycena pura]
MSSPSYCIPRRRAGADRTTLAPQGSRLDVFLQHTTATLRGGATSLALTHLEAPSACGEERVRYVREAPRVHAHEAQHLRAHVRPSYARASPVTARGERTPDATAVRARVSDDVQRVQCGALRRSVRPVRLAAASCIPSFVFRKSQAADLQVEVEVFKGRERNKGLADRVDKPAGVVSLPPTCDTVSANHGWDAGLTRRCARSAGFRQDNEIEWAKYRHPAWT